MKNNYADHGGCYPPRPITSVILLPLHPASLLAAVGQRGILLSVFVVLFDRRGIFTFQ